MPHCPWEDPQHPYGSNKRVAYGVKPRIRWNVPLRHWHCIGKRPGIRHLCGFGDSPSEAYREWLSL